MDDVDERLVIAYISLNNALVVLSDGADMVLNKIKSVANSNEEKEIIEHTFKLAYAIAKNECEGIQ